MPRSPKLLDQVRSAIRINHYSPRTEEAYMKLDTVRNTSR